MDHVTSTLSAVGAGIMLEGQEGDLGFAAASNSVVRQVERLQDHAETGACDRVVRLGPCPGHEAFTTNQIVVVPDLRLEDRWGPYTSRALDLGLLSVIGFR